MKLSTGKKDGDLLSGGLTGVDATGWSELRPMQAHTHAHKHIHTLRDTLHPASVPWEGIFHAFKAAGSDRALTTPAYCDTLVGPEEVLTAAPAFDGPSWEGIRIILPWSCLFFFFLIDWHSQSSFWSERRPRLLTPISLSLSPFLSAHGLQVITCIWLKWWICKYETNPYRKHDFLFTFYYTWWLCWLVTCTMLS